MLNRTPCHDVHVALGGRMVPFASWELPVQYTVGPTREHLAVRQAGGLFDVSHMARLAVYGEEALPFLQRILTRDIGKAKPGACTYSLMTYDDGTTVDDVIVNRMDDHWLVVANAANQAKDLEWLRMHAIGFAVTIEDTTDQTAMLACQGPVSTQVLSNVLDVNLRRLRRFRSAWGTFGGSPIQVTRTGYTGENGFELFVPPTLAPDLFQAILTAGQPAGLQACGLAARDSLRLEVAYPLYGQEISAAISPLEANLAWAVSLRKGEFIGRNALLKQKLEATHRRQVGFVMLDRGVPRTGYPVYAGSSAIGHVTSGNRSPSLNQFIGLALVAPPPDLDCLDVEIRGQHKRARIVPLPFYSSSSSG